MLNSNIFLFLAVSQINHLDSQLPVSIQSVGTMYVMKRRQLKEDPGDSLYKSKDPTRVEAQQKEDVFGSEVSYR